MMGIRSNQTAAALVGTLLLALILAAPPGGPASAAPEDVQRDLVDVAGADEPHTPPALNRAIAFRYHAPHAARPSAALVLIPGLNSGPNSLDLISRALVTAYGPSLEVWAVALRSTQLQDRKGVEEALAYGNPDFALAYYYGKLPIGGQTFHLVRGPEVPYMAYWGMDVHLRDIRALMQEIRTRYPGVPVVLGGHSLGGIMAAAYAGYNFAELSGPGPAPHASRTRWGPTCWCAPGSRPRSASSTASRTPRTSIIAGCWTSRAGGRSRANGSSACRRRRSGGAPACPSARS